MDVTPIANAANDTQPPVTHASVMAYNLTKSIIGKSAGVVSEYLGPGVSGLGRFVSYIADPKNTTPSSLVFGALCVVLVWKGITCAVAPWKTNWYQFQERFTSKTNIANKLISFEELIKKPMATLTDAAKAAQTKAEEADSEAKRAGASAIMAGAAANAAQTRANQAHTQARVAIQLGSPPGNPIRVTSNSNVPQNGPGQQALAAPRQIRRVHSANAL